MSKTSSVIQMTHSGLSINDSGRKCFVGYFIISNKKMIVKKSERYSCRDFLVNPRVDGHHPVEVDIQPYYTNFWYKQYLVRLTRVFADR